MSTQPNTTDLDRLEALAKAATPGKWTAQRHGVIVAGPYRQYTNGSAQSQIAAFTSTFHDDDPEDEPCRKQANAEFCAAANPAVILELIQLARRSQPVAATQQAAREQQEPVAFCAPDAKGKPLFRKGWMFSPIQNEQATMPLYAAPVIAQQSEAGVRQWEGSLAQVVMDVPLPERNDKYQSGFVDAKRAILGALRAAGFDSRPVEAGAPTVAATSIAKARKVLEEIKTIHGSMAATMAQEALDALDEVPTSDRESAAPGAQQDAKDAARYRWLRNNSNRDQDHSETVQMVVDGLPMRALLESKHADVWPPKRFRNNPGAPYRVAMYSVIDEMVDAAMQKGAQ